MWKIYVVILTLSTQSFNAQEGIYVTNSREGSEKSTIKTLDLYSEYNNNTDLTSVNTNNTIINSAGTYNKNSEHLIGSVQGDKLLLHTKEINIIMLPQNASTLFVKNFSTYSITTQSPHAWKVHSRDYFNSILFYIMSSKAQYENLIYSPISLQALLAFIFTISDGKLYEELAQLLAISNNRTYVAKTFENILQTDSLNGGVFTTLIMANKLYYDFRFGPVDHSVRNFAKKSFASELESIDFSSSKKAVNLINSWVSERTHNLIQDIVTPSSINGETSAIFLNTLYFKSEWLTKFATYDTETQDFFMSKQAKIPVNMMYNEDVFRYGEFPNDLHASVVELPYKTSNLSMLLILPNDTEGLSDLERKLGYYDYESISRELKRETVIVKLPRFKIEYEIDMIKPLRQMGLNALFNNAGNINIFKNQQKPLRIDQFKHKCFINVNEAGTVAAAATVAKYVPLSLPIEMKYFVADHPFVFVIRDANTTFFIGHVVQF